MTAPENLSPIAQAISQLRQLTQLDVIPDWQVCERDCAIGELSRQSFTKLQPNDKNYLVWEKGQKVRWFYQEFVVPNDLQGYPLVGLTLRLALTWWAELAEVFVHGEKVQDGDLFDHSCRVVLSDRATPGEKIPVAIRLISPGHDIGGLMRSQLLYESSYDTIDPGFVADELAILQNYVSTLEPHAELNAEIDWAVVQDRSKFDQSLQQMRDRLLGFSDRIKQHTISLLGHAHLDMAWLWDVEETWRAAERTFRSVLNLQQEFPDLTFCHTTPALYAWIEQNRPEMFAEIVERVQEGRWEVVGGMWVEPEMNLISGEAIARHLLYGQRYQLKKFGKVNRVEWLPDTFGFSWQLPQFLKQAGIDYFVTQKLRWNDTNKYPHEMFNWQAPDGSQVFSLMSSPIGEGIDPIKMTDYAWEWMTRTQRKRCLWLFGVGDHGGGPTRDMLKLQERWAKSPFFPTMQFTSALDYLESVRDPSELPIWNDELYLEFHRGCYTTHGDQKRFNRASEVKLYDIELWAALATIVTELPYPKEDLERAWKIVLFNQFHDILPGTSIQKVYQDFVLEKAEFRQICDQIAGDDGIYRDRNRAKSERGELDDPILGKTAIAQHIQFPEPPHPSAIPIVVFNSCNWQRSGFVESGVWLPMFDTEDWQIYDLEGQSPLQKQLQSTVHPGTLKLYSFVFYAEEIPPVGYRCFWLCPTQKLAPGPQIKSQQDEFSLENEFLRVVIDPATGNIASLFDKKHQREVLNGFGNELQAYQDSGQYWDAWNIDPNYAHHPLASSQLVSIRYGLWQGLIPTIEIKRRVGTSAFQQTYSLEFKASILKIHTTVDWQERHVVVKAAFPFALESDRVTCEIPGGAIAQTTQPKNEVEKAKWEVPMLGWVDLSDDNYGVSLLSDCKHGLDCQPNQVRLTLLRGSEFPDPKADLGSHEFTIALYPHAGSWQMAQSVRKAYELRQPLQHCGGESSGTGTLPPVGSLLDLQSENLILASLKQSEEDPNAWILRCYECHGEATELKLKSDLGLKIADSVDLLERPDEGTTAISPWQVRSFLLRKS